MAGKSKVCLWNCDYDSVRATLSKVFDEFPLEIEGKRVLVKPNMLGPYPPESHVCTHPSVIEALVKLLEEQGADQIWVGDNPGIEGYGAVEKTAVICGHKQAAGTHFTNIGTEVEKVSLPGSGDIVNVSKKVLDCDVLISVPKFKTHTFTMTTGAIKNSFGFLVGGDKARIHVENPDYRDFSEALVDIFRLRVPDLFIMDAVVGIQGNGPSGKATYPVGKVIASCNGVALDAVMATMMGWKPDKVWMVRQAGKLGLGPLDLDRIEVKGDMERLDRFSKPMPGLPQVFGGRWMSALYPGVGRPRFAIDEVECTACAGCQKACPVGAVKVMNRLPEYDYKKCISCYCCMELCPSQAISLKTTMRVRIMRATCGMRSSSWSSSSASRD